MSRKRVTVTSETNTRRNEKFHANYNGNNMKRAKFVKETERGNYQNYHIRNINGVNAPELYRQKCEHERQLAELAKNVITNATAQEPIQ